MTREQRQQVDAIAVVQARASANLSGSLCLGEFKTLTEAELAELGAALEAADRAAARAKQYMDLGRQRFSGGAQ